MMFVEVFVPRGTLTHDQRRRVSERLMTGLMPEEGAPAESVEAARAFTQVVVHEPETWIVGGRSVAPTDPPRYVVRVSVPGAWRKEMSALIIPEVTRALAEIDPDPSRLYDESHAWVHVVGIAEGSCGVFGQAMGSTDIVKVITKSYREGAQGDRTEDLPPGTALDPVCGMTVPLADAAKIVKQDGTTYAFCGSACHAVFAQDQRAAVH
ncbi:MAG: hypothetical protein GEV09_19940 [Pseudonocardiaceae bacterium]|nr:hypothetical protein [Pseudonocardiaceae bacterium]